MTFRTQRPALLLHRRRRRWSRGILSVLLAVALLLADCEAVDFLTPVSVGMRSALTRRTGRWTSRGSPTGSRRCVRGVIPATAAGEEEEDDFVVESALFRSRTPEERARRSVSHPAFLRSTPRIPESELECLEESSVQLVAASAASPSVRLAASSSRTRTADGRTETANGRGGASLATRPLQFWENMICGAISRSVAQTTMHPANTMKTILQNSRGATAPSPLELMQPKNFQRLARGAGANFLLSVPHGAINFAVLEFVRQRIGAVVQSIPALADKEDKIGPGLDFLSSSISTVACSVVSTPQMMITDNIMAGNYPNLPAAARGLAQSRGIMGFYGGWWPGLVGKIPSYALTWTFFQQLKRVRDSLSNRPATNLENSVMGVCASATTVCIMIPMDTIKTRLVTQVTSGAGAEAAYKGIIDAAVRIFREEGISAFYRGLSPRLVSVVPMIGIQFGVYEFMKKVMVSRTAAKAVRMEAVKEKELVEEYGPEQVMEEAAMEVAASPEQPFPAPHFLKRILKQKKKKAATLWERMLGKNSRT